MTRSLRILLVEDSEDILFIMSSELEALGYHVDVASDGWQALKLADLNRPDVIISDVQMPGMNGFDLIREVRRKPELATVPAIAMTGFGMASEIKELVSSGFTMHVIKPVEPDHLGKLIRKLTEPKKLTRAS
jgi:two-component system CheB/CheR fusion protein